MKTLHSPKTDKQVQMFIVQNLSMSSRLRLPPTNAKTPAAAKPNAKRSSHKNLKSQNLWRILKIKHKCQRIITDSQTNVRN